MISLWWDFIFSASIKRLFQYVRVIYSSQWSIFVIIVIEYKWQSCRTSVLYLPHNDRPQH